MDPISHAIAGIGLSKVTQSYIGTGYLITTAVVIGSLLPDADIVLQKWGDYFYLKNHRVASHSLVGVALGSLVTGALLTCMNRGSGLLVLCLSCFIGAIGHIILDVFNSYGAVILWPLSNKKFSISLLPIVDPIIIGIVLGYIFTSNKISWIFVGMGAVYLILRLLAKLLVRLELNQLYKGKYKEIHILPSTTRLFRWHFIVDIGESNIIGETGPIFRKVKIFRELEKAEHSLTEKIEDVAIMKFFKEFTPLYHVTCRKIDNGISEFLLTDLRYFLRNNFLHHATAILDSEYKPLKEFFQPYNIDRRIEM